MVPLREITLPLYGDDGRAITSLRIVPRRWDSIPAPLTKVDSVEAREWGEEPVQLIEGATYDYEVPLTDRSYRLQEGMFQKGGLSDAAFERGTISPRGWTGLLSVVLEDKAGNRLARTALEIRSSKLAYRTDYRDMLDFIAEICIDLLFDLRAPSLMRLSPRSTQEASSVAQRFSFARHFVSSRDFRDAIARIIKFPHDRTAHFEEEQSSRQSFRPTIGLLRQVASRQPRIGLPPSHPLHGTLGSLPLNLSLPQLTRVLDTPENRFVKYALSSFEAFFEGLVRQIGSSKRSEDIRLKREIDYQRSQISEILSHSFFRTISEATLLPLGSSVLQRRPGYREILNAWLKFNLAASLEWAGGDDVYGGGKRDVATLYEYWVFFQLLQLFVKQFSLPAANLAPLIESTGDGFGMKLKSGTHIAISGVFRQESRSFHVKFSFNRTFLHIGPKIAEANYPAPGSWTRRMRPDYTLSLWPLEYDEEAAERKNAIVHIHFDAKYRVDNLSEFFGEDDDAALEDATSARREGRTAKRDDLLKMHAYRDAIRRSEGAYILYPGTESIKWRGYHELLPGLGAFAVSPNDERGLQELSTFIEDTLQELSNRTSQREETAYEIYRIHKMAPSRARFGSAFPETDTAGERLPPPKEMVLICSGRHLKGIDTLTQEGRLLLAIRHGEPLLRYLSAQYILWHDFAHAQQVIPQLWRVAPNGYEFSDERAAAQTTPVSANQDPHILFHVEQIGGQVDEYRWSSRSLESLGLSELSEEPMALPLDRVLAAAAPHCDPKLSE